MIGVVLKDGFDIYFAYPSFVKPIYSFGTGIGFSNRLPVYVIETHIEATKKLLLDFYELEKNPINDVSLRLAVNQVVSTYAFPERIIGFRNGTVEVEFQPQ